MKLFSVMSVEELNKELEQKLSDFNKIIEIDLPLSMGYSLAEDIFAVEDTPQFFKSTVDGYALSYLDTLSASESMPSVFTLSGQIAIGEDVDYELDVHSCVYIHTGAMLPRGANAVIMIEQTEKFSVTNEILCFKSLAFNENVTIPGSDIKKETLLFEKLQVVDERVMAVLAAQGINRVKVLKPLEAIIISSGNELVKYDEQISRGEIRDINSFLIRGLLEKFNIKVKASYLLSDNRSTYVETLRKHRADLYITSGGSSQGNEDYTFDVFNDLTDNIICHGLAIKPGKPTIVAASENSIYLGLPGNPVSAYLVLQRTLISILRQNYKKSSTKIYCNISQNIKSAPGKESIILVKLSDNYKLAHPIFYRSSNVLALSQADGYVIIKSGLEGLNENDKVEVLLF